MIYWTLNYFYDKAVGESKQGKASHCLPESKHAYGGVHARVWTPPYTYMDAVKQEKCIIKHNDMILGSYVLSPQLSLMSNSCKIQSSGIGLPKSIPYLLEITSIIC